VAVDRHRGDAAGLGDLGHGEWRALYMRWALLIRDGVILGLRPPVRPRARAAIKPAWVRSLMRAASYSAIKAKMPKTKLPWAVVVSTMPLVSDRTDPAGLQGGDDVDEVAQVAPEPVNFPEDQGVAAAQVGQAGVPLRTVSFGSGGGAGVDLQAVGGTQGVELQLRVLVGGGLPVRTRFCRPRPRTQSQPMGAWVLCGLEYGGELRGTATCGNASGEKCGDGSPADGRLR